LLIQKRSFVRAPWVLQRVASCLGVCVLLGGGSIARADQEAATGASPVAPRTSGVVPANRGGTIPAPAAPAAGASAPAAAGQALGCVIEPMNTAEVAASASGVLESVLVDRGALVRRGQVLAVLQSEVERAAVEAARERAASASEVAALAASRDLARTRLKRMHALTQLEFGARLELETAVAEFEIADHRLHQAREAFAVAQREHDLARRQLEQRQIRSPIDGVVADRLLHPGERVDGRPILRLVALDRLRVEVVVPASRFGRIREGMHASVRPELPDGRDVSGRVVQVDRFVDAASGTFRARLSLPNREGGVPAGVRCQVVFDDTGVPAVRPASHRPSAAVPAGVPAKPVSRPAGAVAGPARGT
jgi:RND family efflux transporter MFP subunit